MAFSLLVGGFLVVADRVRLLDMVKAEISWNNLKTKDKSLLFTVNLKKAHASNEVQSKQLKVKRFSG